MNRTLLRYLIFGLFSLCFIACSENKGDVPYIKYEDMNEAMDTIVAKNSYSSLPAKEIVLSIRKNSKHKSALNLPDFSVSDSTVDHEYIHGLAISSVYATWAHELKQPKLKDIAFNHAMLILERIGLTEESKMLLPKMHSDSLSNFLSNYFSQDGLANKNAYFQAIEWLENFYISLNFEKNVINKTDYNKLIVRQLMKGEDLLEYLYDFQDYPPIAKFSVSILEILDCRNYELNVTQIKQLVIDSRTNQLNI